MLLQKTFVDNDFMLMEAAVIETLRRSGNVSFHTYLEHAPLIYNKEGKNALEQIYKNYISIAQKADVPIFICTPTWRTNHERMQKSCITKDINRDCVNFLKKIRSSLSDNCTSKVLIGGLIGCKNDCYKPEEALSIDEAKNFHSWQILKLAEAGVDLLFAATIPNLEESIGIALSMKTTKIPYIISFVINSDGFILDGTSLDDALQKVDFMTKDNPPIGYMINCSHPSFLKVEKQSAYVFDRLIGYQANASSKNHNELEDNNTLQVDNIDEWAELMASFKKEYGIKILGGCCGTNSKHLENIVQKINRPY